MENRFCGRARNSIPGVGILTYGRRKKSVVTSFATVVCGEPKTVEEKEKKKKRKKRKKNGGPTRLISSEPNDAS